MSDSSDNTREPSKQTGAATRRAGWLDRVDRWMAAHPWHVRFAPFVVYVLLLWMILSVRDWRPESYPFLYTAQCLIVLAMLWRYRKLTPELTLGFHWLAVPVGLAGAAAWMGLAFGMEALSPSWFEHREDSFFEQMPAPLAWASMILRLLGMAIVVPMFEELVFRSAVMRSLHRPRPAGVALLQLAEDLPIMGDRVMQTEVSKRTSHERHPIADAFHRTPLGAISAFNLIATGLLWCVISHIMRDWPGTIACALLYGYLVWATNRGDRRLGLGPVIWAHGITNACLWGYTLIANDWRFL